MSGESHDGLHTAQDLADLLRYTTQLDRLVDDLSGLGYAPDLARETMGLLLDVRACQVRIEARLERLRPAWKAYIWWESADSDEESFRKALQAYREGEKE